MPSEDENPERIYLHSRPRQSARGLIDFIATTNFPTVSLYNDSTGPQLIVIRDFNLGVSATTGPIAILPIRGIIGASGGSVYNYVPDEGRLPGVLYQLDDATVRPNTVNPAHMPTTGWPFSWRHDFPIQVLPPGWAWLVQLQVAAGEVSLEVTWEAVFPEELDFTWY